MACEGAQADPHLPDHEYASELYSVFPIPMHQNWGIRGACIDTPSREQRGKETPSVKQKQHTRQDSRDISSAAICHFPCPFWEATSRVQTGISHGLIPLRELGVPNFLSSGTHLRRLVFLKALGFL